MCYCESLFETTVCRSIPEPGDNLPCFFLRRTPAATRNLTQTSSSGLAVEQEFTRTIIVGETSDFFWQSGTTRQRINGSYGCGWLCGTNTNLTVAGAITTSHQFYNMTTVRFNVGVNGKPATNSPPASATWGANGVTNNHGCNNPLLSAHPSGAQAAFMD